MTARWLPYRTVLAWMATFSTGMYRTAYVDALMACVADEPAWRRGGWLS